MESVFRSGSGQRFTSPHGLALTPTTSPISPPTARTPSLLLSFLLSFCGGGSALSPSSSGGHRRFARRAGGYQRQIDRAAAGHRAPSRLLKWISSRALHVL
ncbi:hypothetical protein VPH35_094813 [Triticum aestivum]